jgi:peptidyl-prolyl cis-trans isomerase D
VAEADARSYYEKNKARYGTEEQRRASHILITTEGRDKAAAKKEADALLVRVQANPKDFAKLAREYSKDPGSAAQGGDLGFFGKGMMTKPFEDAAGQLKPGETSGVIESDFGYHIIRLTEIKPAEVRSFDEVRPEIEKELKTQQAQKRFAEAAEQFTNLVYEQSDSLKPAADRLGLKPRSADRVTRSGLPAAPNQPQILNARVVEALFADDSIKGKRNTQAIEVAPNTLVAARVVEYRPAAVRPFDELKAAIRQRLERQQAANLAREAGQARLTELRANPSDTGFSPVLAISRRASQGVPPTVLNEVLRAPADKLPAYVGADIEGAGFLIAHVLASKPGDSLDAAQREAQSRALGQQVALSDELAYSEALRIRHDAHIVRPEFKRNPVKEESKADVKADTKTDAKSEPKK